VVRLSVFVAVSAVFAYVSRRCLRNPRSHGFYRFFGFELLAALILYNAPWWVVQPLSASQIVSWVLLVVSLALAAHGFRLLIARGKPVRDDTGTNFAFENTTVLVSGGLYRYIRHPMYASLLALAWGAFLKHVAAVPAALLLGASLFIVAQTLAEERENLKRFGAPYGEYMKQTRRFIPFVL
jgi:protein-S-isoprenylcysteine O-methyltransferase Ste14